MMVLFTGGPLDGDIHGGLPMKPEIRVSVDGAVHFYYMEEDVTSDARHRRALAVYAGERESADSLVDLFLWEYKSRGSGSTSEGG